ncbi:hypothetical protein N0V90_011884 [Kalmusia sp. IMI 367209]|nr:hypothetical protein N0V90_011884 [Kalmusia sp. IMI 367209]
MDAAFASGKPSSMPPPQIALTDDRSPSQSIPPELLMMIAEYVDAKKDLSALCLVSKTFRRIAQKLLFRSLDLPSYYSRESRTLSHLLRTLCTRQDLASQVQAISWHATSRETAYETEASSALPLDVRECLHSDGKLTAKSMEESRLIGQLIGQTPNLRNLLIRCNGPYKNHGFPQINSSDEISHLLGFHDDNVFLVPGFANLTELTITVGTITSPLLMLPKLELLRISDKTRLIWRGQEEQALQPNVTALMLYAYFKSFLHRGSESQNSVLHFVRRLSTLKRMVINVHPTLARKIKEIPPGHENLDWQLFLNSINRAAPQLTTLYIISRRLSHWMEAGVHLMHGKEDQRRYSSLYG